MPKKVTMKENSFQRLTANDYAFVKFARFRGVGYAAIGRALGRTEGSAGNIGHKINSFESGYLLRNNYSYQDIKKGLILEAQVRGGLANDMRKAWIDKLNRAQGKEIEVKVREELVEKGEAKETPVIESEKAEAIPESTEEQAAPIEEEDDGVVLEVRETPLLSINIAINEKQLLKLIEKLFT